MKYFLPSNLIVLSSGHRLNVQRDNRLKPVGTKLPECDHTVTHSASKNRWVIIYAMNSEESLARGQWQFSAMFTLVGGRDHYSLGITQKPETTAGRRCWIAEWWCYGVSWTEAFAILRWWWTYASQEGRWRGDSFSRLDIS